MALSDAEYQHWLKTAAASEKCLLVTLNSSDGPLYLASQAYISMPTDSLPNQPFASRFTDFPEISQGDSLDVGDFEFSWPERVAELRERYWRGYAYQMRLGGKTWSYDDFRLITSGYIDGVARTSQDRLRVDFADAGAELEQPVADARINDVLLPVCIGSVRNIQPVLIDDVAHEYAVHDGPIDALIVRVDGVAVSPVVSWDEGTFHFNSQPEGTITADVTVTDSLTVQTAIQWLASRRGIVDPAFDWFQDDQLAAEIGLYLTTEDDYLSVLQRIADAMGAGVVYDALNQLHVVVMDHNRDADIRVTDDDMPGDAALSEAGEIRSLSEITLQYGQLGYVQDDLVDYQSQWQSVSLKNDNPPYPDGWSETLTLDGILNKRTDALVELQKLAAWRFQRHIRYQFDVFLRGSLLKRGSRIAIDSRSWGLSIVATVTRVERRPVSNRFTVECVA